MLNLETGKTSILTDQPNFDFIRRSGRYIFTIKKPRNENSG